MPLAPAYKNDMGDGPRATPTIDDGRVYSFTGEGILHCNKLDDGASIWHRNLVKEYNTKASEYGMSSSPLVADGLVIVQVGGDNAAVVAVDAATGKTAWTAGNGRAGYSSPALLNVAGKPQLVAFAGSGCLGIEAKTGNVVWQYPFPTDYDCNTATPIAINDHILISSGENHGSVLLKLDGAGSATEVWKSLGTGSALRSEWQTPLLAGKLLFGFDNVGSAGPVTNLACLDATTGKVLWKQMRFGKSNGVFADGKLIISTMDGELVIVRAASEKFDELARAQVIGKTRQAPAIADGFAFLRDDEHIVCLDLRKL
jgi:outer membrane protein assembly factor BamB